MSPLPTDYNTWYSLFFRYTSSGITTYSSGQTFSTLTNQTKAMRTWYYPDLISCSQVCNFSLKF